MERSFILKITESEEGELDIYTKIDEYSYFEIVGLLETVKQTMLNNIRNDFDSQEEKFSQN